MVALHQLFVALFDESGRPLPGAGDFVGRYRQARVNKQAGIFEFARRDEMNSARLDAQQRGLVAENYYAFRVGSGEILLYPGYYLSPLVVERFDAGELFRLEGIQIAKDSDSEKIWIRDDARHFLEPLLRNIRVSPRTEAGGRAWYVIEGIPDLPEPIVVIEERFASPNVGPSLGTYAVQSDGRDVLSPLNIESLRSSGLCQSTRIRTPQSDYRIRPRYVVSAEVMESLVGSHTRGLSESLSPLLDFHDPLVELITQGIDHD